VAPRSRSRLRFDRGGEVRLYDESLHVRDVALALLGKEGTKDLLSRPRRLPRIPSSKFRIHAQPAFVAASMSSVAGHGDAGTKSRSPLGGTAPLQRVQAQIRHKPDPPYGLPPIYSVLSLSSPPLRAERVTVFCFRLFRSLVPRSQKSKTKWVGKHITTL
jgi:hypothetical protein